MGEPVRDRPLAVVMGDMDLVRSLGLAAVRCAVVARPGEPTRFSRFTCAVLDWVDPWDHAEELVERLVHFGRSRPTPPVLFYQEDRELLLVSRHRDRLKQAYRFVVAEPALVEDLVDKSRFQALAERLQLPVPATRRLSPAQDPAPPELDLPFPLILKPLTRRTDRWALIEKGGKALRVDTPGQLRALWPRLAAAGLDLLAQELIPGPESCVESYHCYVDGRGEIVAEFTGRKIRTYPVEYGHSTAVVISEQPDAAALGRDLVRRLRLRGVAKFDFKRGPDGRLHLLEVNPRFNLWHHPGALAGVNIPALVYADLAGLPVPAGGCARPGVRWCQLWHDAPAARASGVPLARWVPWALRCEAKSAVAWDDPMPFLHGVLWRQLARRWHALRKTHGTPQPAPQH